MTTMRKEIHSEHVFASGFNLDKASKRIKRINSFERNTNYIIYTLNTHTVCGDIQIPRKRHTASYTDMKLYGVLYYQNLYTNGRGSVQNYRTACTRLLSGE